MATIVFVVMRISGMMRQAARACVTYAFALELVKVTCACWTQERATAMQQVRAVMGMRKLPRRIEGYDISHMQGTGAVASVSVLVDGIPQAQLYRCLVLCACVYACMYIRAYLHAHKAVCV